MLAITQTCGGSGASGRAGNPSSVLDHREICLLRLFTRGVVAPLGLRPTAIGVATLQKDMNAAAAQRDEGGEPIRSTDPGEFRDVWSTSLLKVGGGASDRTVALMRLI